MRSIQLFTCISLFACGGGTYNQGSKIVDDDDTGEVDDTGSDTADTEDTETGDTEDTEDTEDTTPPEPELCKTDYQPIHEGGWTKTFLASFEGKTAQAQIQALGETTFNGNTVYAYKDVITDENQGGWDVTSYVSCDEETGLTLVGWSGVSTEMLELIPGFPIPQVRNIEATLNPGRNYLPAEFATGGLGSWEYNYSLDMMVDDNSGNGPQPFSQQMSGRFDEYGLDNELTLFDGTVVSAYKINNSFSITDSFGQLQEGYIEQYWVKGLGMVKETYINPADQSVILSKELSAYTGLSVIE